MTVWADVCDLIGECLKTAGVRPEDVMAVAATSQRGGMVFLDRKGGELYGGPNQDVRAFFEGMEIDDQRGEGIYSVTGRLPSFLFAPARLKWFQVHQPKIFEKIDAVLPINDWLTFRMSGQVRCARSALGEIGLLNIAVGEKDPLIMKGLDIGLDVVPALGHAGQQVGEVTAAASGDTGLREGTPVVLGGPDTQCGLLGMGVVETEQLGILAGWSGPLQLVTSQAIFDCEGRTWTGRHVVAQRWVLESSTTEAGRSLEWFATVLGTDYNEIDIEGTLEKPDYLGQDQAVAYLGPRIMHAKKLGLQQGGFMFPVPVGQMGITREGLLRGALENLVFAIKGNALQLAEVSGIEPSIVCLGGGVTNIRAFPQLAADTLDTAIRVPEIKDPSPLGAAMCAATGVGVYGSLAEAAVEMKAPDRSIEPDKSSASVMEERFERWLSLYRGLEGLSGEL
jgi:autoinducer 2 (AI-2) kinase